MRSGPAGISQRGELAVLALCSLVSMILILLPGEARIQVADRLGRVLTAPYWSARNFLDDVVTLRKQNTRLRKELFSLELETSAVIRERRDRQRGAGCALAEGFNGILAPCRVVTRRRGRFATMIRISSMEPLSWKPWQPVVNRDGMLGRIRTVISPTEAWVELMTAPDFALGVEFQRTGLLGVLQPRGDRFFIEMVGRDEDVRRGDLVMTSGITELREDPAGLSGGVAALRGIPVGKVRSVQVPNDEVFKEIVIDPVAACDRNETVFVVLPATAAGDSAVGHP